MRYTIKVTGEPAIPTVHRRRADFAINAARDVAWAALGLVGSRTTTEARAVLARVETLDPARGGSVVLGDTGRVLFLTPSRSAP